MFLVLGSCRVIVTMNHSKYFCHNTFQEQGCRHLNPKNVIGRGYSLKEHYEMLMLIFGKKKVYDYVGDEYKDINEIIKNIENIRSCLNEITCVIIEPCSLKYYKDVKNRLVHNVLNHNGIYKEFNMTAEECHLYIKKIIELLSDKKIIFVNHFLHNSIPSRILIRDCLKIHQSKNVNMITPSEKWNINNVSDYLADPNHYRNDKYKEIANYIDYVYEKEI